MTEIGRCLYDGYFSWIFRWFKLVPKILPQEQFEITTGENFYNINFKNYLFLYKNYPDENTLQHIYIVRGYM